jgi:hypothetical protein
VAVIKGHVGRHGFFAGQAYVVGCANLTVHCTWLLCAEDAFLVSNDGRD